MALNNSTDSSGANGSLVQMQHNESLGWKDLTPKRVPRNKGRHRNLLAALSIFFLVALILAALRFSDRSLEHLSALIY